MTISSSGQPWSRAQRPITAENKSPRYSRSTRLLLGKTRQLTRSEEPSLAWRIIAGRTKPGEAHGLLRAWPGWEQFARNLWPVYEIPDAPYRLLCLRIVPYRGETMVLPDSTTVASGVVLGELHCNNRAIFDLVNRRENPFAAGRADLASLSNWTVHDRVGRNIEAFYGRTILTPAAIRLGFVVREKPTTFRLLLEKFFFRGLLLLYNQEGVGRLQHGSTADNYPADVWMSRRQLLRLYYR